VAILPAVGAFVVGLRRLLTGEWLWGSLALVAGFMLALFAALTAWMVIALRQARRGDVIVLRPATAPQFMTAAAAARLQLDSDSTAEERQAVAVELWELAWRLSQPASFGGDSRPAADRPRC
jgi:hypothetical protein